MADRRQVLIFGGLALAGAAGVMALSNQKPAAAAPVTPPAPQIGYYLVIGRDGTVLFRLSSMTAAINQARISGCGVIVQLEGGGVVFRTPACVSAPGDSSPNPGPPQPQPPSDPAAAKPSALPVMVAIRAIIEKATSPIYIVSTANGTVVLRTFDPSQAIARAVLGGVGMSVSIEGRAGFFYGPIVRPTPVGAVSQLPNTQPPPPPPPPAPARQQAVAASGYSPTSAPTGPTWTVTRGPLQ